MRSFSPILSFNVCIPISSDMDKLRCGTVRYYFSLVLALQLFYDFMYCMYNINIYRMHNFMRCAVFPVSFPSHGNEVCLLF